MATATNNTNATAKQRQVDGDSTIVDQVSGNRVSLAFNSCATATTASDTAGGATLPTHPIGFVEAKVGGKIVKIPYWAV